MSVIKNQHLNGWKLITIRCNYFFVNAWYFSTNPKTCAYSRDFICETWIFSVWNEFKNSFINNLCYFLFRWETIQARWADANLPGGSRSKERRNRCWIHRGLQDLRQRRTRLHFVCWAETLPICHGYVVKIIYSLDASIMNGGSCVLQ